MRRYTFLTQKERDEESGLDFFNARYYGSMLGRFTSPDQPFADQYESDPQSWNLYVYVSNNPLIYTDPTGLWKEVECSGTAKLCYEAEKGDTIDSFAKKLHFDPKKLNDYFNNPTVSEGQVYDISGYTGGYVIHDGGVEDVSMDFALNIVGPVKSLFGAIGRGIVGAFARRAVQQGVKNEAQSGIITLGISGGVRQGLTAVQKLRNLSGMSRAAARQELKKEGFQYKGNTAGGYEKWYHPDGSKIQIRPNGEVVRVPSNNAVNAAGKTGGGWRVDPESGDVVRPHTSSVEKVQ
jgi:RHS repeat-associated protein